MPVEAKLNTDAYNQTSPNVLDRLKPEQAIRLAKKKIKEGSFEDAKGIYKDILVKFPKNKRALDGIKSLSGGLIGKTLQVQEPPQEQLQQVINLYQQGQLQWAIDSANQLLSQFPNSLTLYNIQGAANAGLGQLNSAIDSYKQAIKIKPDYAEAYNNMGVAQQDKGDLNAAIASYKQALKIKPGYANAYYNMGNALKDTSDLEAAIDSYQQALKIEPGLAEAYYNMGDVLQDKGDLEASINSYKQALKFKPDYAEAHYNLGNALSNKGDIEVAIDSYQQALKIKPDYAQAYNNMGNALSNKGDLNAAIDSYKNALKFKPDYAEAYYNMGTIIESEGDLKAAIDSYKQALKIKPDYAEAYNNMGNALRLKGDLETAIDSFNQALKIKPDYAKAYYNIGNALMDKGDLDATIDNYQQALRIKPDYAEVYNNMGNALSNKGDLEAAIDSYQKALKIMPDYADAYNNMGIVLKDKGDFYASIDSYQQALKIRPDYPEAYYNMGIALKEVRFTEPNSGLMEIIVSLLNQRTSCRPKDIAQAAISLLKLEPNLKKLLEKHSLGTLRQSLEETISTLIELPLLLRLMSVCPTIDLELESILVDIRQALLFSVDEIFISPEILHFQSALALQCFTNEYIYTQTEKETDVLNVLKNAVEKVLSNGQQPSPQSVLCLASYASLYEFEWCDLLTVNTDIEEVVARQVLEPKEESRLKANIPILQEITDKVSSKVRAQYEDNPYPRWVNLGLFSNPVLLSKLTKELNLKLSNKTINDVEAPNVLIAGCGTGQHSIGTASRFKDCNVLAIDISLSSLAYAKRKTEELSLKNIDYMQADLLDLGQLDKKFDIIESSGVLHHMENPMAGWKVLAGCLKSGGLMKIGLYSELARVDIVKIREEINQSGMESSSNAMKQFRSDLLNSSEEHHKNIRLFSDFYSVSELRDLLFHVQEHRFIAPQIKDCLSDLGLKFCGFEAGKIVQDFRLKNTEPDDPYDLDKWNTYEKSNPNLFVGMYQFWCQKVG